MEKPELSAFGWWFACGRFGADWTYRRLEQVLERTNVEQANLFVIQRMAATVAQYPSAALRCLRLFIEGTQDPWGLGSAGSGPKPDTPWYVLETCLAMDDPEIRERAEDIVHLLGSKGFLEYRELLRRDPASGPASPAGADPA